MNKEKPMFDPATHYRIEVQGQVDVEWLQSFDSSVEIIPNEAGPMEDITVLNMHTDQAGIVGLLRRLHGLGMTILHIQMVPERGEGTDVEEQ